jgi:cytochrome c556
MMPGRASGPDWVAYSQELTVAAQAAMAAADARDADALFDAGGQLYQACRACHDQYMVPLLEARRNAE